MKAGVEGVGLVKEVVKVRSGNFNPYNTSWVPDSRRSLDLNVDTEVRHGAAMACLKLVIRSVVMTIPTLNHKVFVGFNGGDKSGLRGRLCVMFTASVGKVIKVAHC